MAIRSSSGFSHLRPGAFYMLYKHTTDATYIIESGRKKNKQARTWVSFKRKKKFWPFSVVFCTSVAIVSVYPSEIPTQAPEKLTHPFALADLASESTGPNSSLGSHISLTVAFLWLSLTVFFCWLPWDLAFPHLLPVSQEISRANPLSGNPLTGAHPHPYPQKRMPHIVLYNQEYLLRQKDKMVQGI